MSIIQLLAFRKSPICICRKSAINLSIAGDITCAWLMQFLWLSYIVYERTIYVLIIFIYRKSPICFGRKSANNLSLAVRYLIMWSGSACPILGQKLIFPDIGSKIGFISFGFLALLISFSFFSDCLNTVISVYVFII